MTATIESPGAQTEKWRSITSAMRQRRTPEPCRHNPVTMSRSDTMPAIEPSSSVTTSAPRRIRFIASTAATTRAPVETVCTVEPLARRIASTSMALHPARARPLQLLFELVLQEAQDALVLLGVALHDLDDHRPDRRAAHRAQLAAQALELAGVAPLAFEQRLG